MKRLVSLLCGCLSVFTVQAGIQVSDDTGQAFEFDQPLTRIVSLSPHITELLFAAGAEQQILGTVSFSNYPPQASRIPLVGSYSRFDAERIAALQPQLIIAWHSGNPAAQVDMLKKTGVPVFYSEPHDLGSIATTLRQFGQLLGTKKTADAAALHYMQTLHDLQKRYSNREPVSVFYQVWHQPLMTVNSRHLISQIISLCGGVNVFAELPVLVPQVDAEAVMAKNPQAILVGMDEAKQELRYDWQRWPQLRAVQQRHVYYLDSDTIARHTPRILQGASSICRQLDAVRADRPSVEK